MSLTYVVTRLIIIQALRNQSPYLLDTRQNTVTDFSLIHYSQRLMSNTIKHGYDRAVFSLIDKSNEIIVSFFTSNTYEAKKYSRKVIVSLLDFFFAQLHCFKRNSWYLFGIIVHYLVQNFNVT